MATEVAELDGGGVVVTEGEVVGVAGTGGVAAEAGSVAEVAATDAGAPDGGGAVEAPCPPGEAQLPNATAPTIMTLTVTAALTTARRINPGRR